MPSKTFIIGFVSGVVFTLIVSIAALGIIDSNSSTSPDNSGLLAASQSLKSGLTGSNVIPASNLDSRDGLSEVEKMRYALEKIVSELDTIGDRIYNLERPLGKIADNMR